MAPDYTPDAFWAAGGSILMKRGEASAEEITFDRADELYEFYRAESLAASARGDEPTAMFMARNAKSAADACLASARWLQAGRRAA